METSSVCDFLSARVMSETRINCCVSNFAQATVIPNVNKSADAQPDYRVMIQVIQTSVDRIMMTATSDKEYLSLAFIVPEFGHYKVCANCG